MHITQKNVIAKLMYAGELRYSEIKPADISGNRFSYHLDKLLTEKLIEKNSNGLYSLTQKGMELTDRLTYKTMKQTVQPKVAAGVLLQPEPGTLLLQRRGRQPMSNTWAIPSSRVRTQEHPIDAAQRVLHERMEFTEAKTPVFKNVVSLRFNGDDTRFLTDIILLVYVLDEQNAAQYTPNSERYAFVDVAKASKAYALFPGVREVLKTSPQNEGLVSVDIDL